MASIENCIKCGAKKGSKPFLGLLCIDCYTPKIEVPNSLSFEFCGRCDKVKQGKDWKKVSLWELGDQFGRKIKGKDALDSFVDIGKAEAIVNLETDQGKFPLKFPIRINKLKSLCDDCRKMAGGYFEAIIQLRGRPERVRRWKKELSEELLKYTFIAGIEDLKEGVDIKVGSSKQALSLIKDLGFRDYLISKKLWGLKQGKRVYRTTFALRFD
jgi:nonsense-mediated mRNA decay protein 3